MSVCLWVCVGLVSGCVGVLVGVCVWGGVWVGCVSGCVVVGGGGLLKMGVSVGSGGDWCGVECGGGMVLYSALRNGVGCVMCVL